MTLLRWRAAAISLLAASGLVAGGAAASGSSRAGGGALSSAPHATIASGGQPWQNPGQPPLARANELLAALSIDQKIQLALGNFSAVQSFGVPALNFTDGPDGVRNAGTTAMPSSQALAASFDRSLAFAYGQVVGAEARGEGFNEWAGPAVDIARTPLAGRQPEAQGEEPFLAGHTSAQEVLGAKSQHVMSTIKHYTAYNQDWGRIGFVQDASGARGRPRTTSCPSGRCGRSTRRRSAPPSEKVGWTR